MPKKPTPRRSLWLIALALILLALIPLAFQQATKAAEPKGPSSHKNPPTTSSSTSRNSSSNRSQRSLTRDLPPSHKTEDLKNFLLPPSELSDLTLQKALDTLFSQYREICLESGEVPISFRYKINGHSEPIVFLKLRGDFLSCCDYLATMSGTKMEVQDNKLIFTEIEDGPMVQRRWTVPPTFKRFLSEKSQRASGHDSPNNDPFATYQPDLPDMGLLLASFGVTGDRDAVSFKTSSSTLTIKAGGKILARIDGLVKAVASDSPTQTRISFLEGEDQPISMIIPTENLSTWERNYLAPDSQDPNYQILLLATEQGFGRKIQTVSFTGSSPSDEERSLYQETEDVADLGIRENLTFATYNISRATDGDPQILTFKDEHGTLHAKTFVTERIDATGRAIPAPQYGEE